MGLSPQESILEKIEGLKISTEDLDELVHEAKAEEASAINNGGQDDQIAYLLGHYGQKELSDLLDDLMAGVPE